MSFESPRIGVIGTGTHATQSHINPTVGYPEGIAMLCDFSQSAVSEAQRLCAPQAEVTTSWRDVFEHSGVDAVSIMTPDAAHNWLLMQAVESGKCAFVEKPLAVTLAEFERLKDGLWAADARGLTISTCHPRRFDPPFVHTKELLDNRRLLAQTFGLETTTELGSVKAFGLGLNYPQPYVAGKHQDFGFDHLGHEIDTTSHFFGFSALTHAVGNIRRELEFDIQAEREDGIELHFTGNRFQKLGSGYREDWKVTFESDSTLIVDAHTGRIVLSHEGLSISRTPKDDDGRPLFTTDYDARFKRLNHHFLEVLKGTEVNYLTDADMLMNTALALATQTVGKTTSISADGTIE